MLIRGIVFRTASHQPCLRNQMIVSMSTETTPPVAYKVPSRRTRQDECTVGFKDRGEALRKRAWQDNIVASCLQKLKTSPCLKAPYRQTFPVRSPASHATYPRGQGCHLGDIALTNHAIVDTLLDSATFNTRSKQDLFCRFQSFVRGQEPRQSWELGACLSD